jgi:hypothetical protein
MALPLADAHNSRQSRDRKGAVARSAEHHGQRTSYVYAKFPYCSRALPNDTPLPARSVCITRSPEPLSVTTNACVCLLD